MSTNETIRKDNPILGDKQPNTEALSRTDEVSVQESEEIGETELEATEDSSSKEKMVYTLGMMYEDLNYRFIESPLELSETKLVKKQYKKLCECLGIRELDSIAIMGDHGIGRSSLVYYLTQAIISGDCPDYLKETQVINFSAIGFPFNRDGIMIEFCNIITNLQENGYDRVIFFFDDFDRYPVEFWANYSSIVDTIISENDGFEFFKFIVTLTKQDMESNPELTSKMLSVSLLYDTVKQEVLTEKIITTLKPRIEEQMEFHNVDEVDPKALEFIYHMRIMDYDGDEDFISYKSFLVNLDKHLSSCECRGIKKYSLEQAIEYYEKREHEDEFFPNRKANLKIARHEAGHALIALVLSKFIYLRCITIIPTCVTSCESDEGKTLVKFNDDPFWQTKPNIIKYIGFYLAGRYAEISDDDIYDNGSDSDLEMANKIARYFVCTSGVFESLGKDFYCDDKDIGNLSEEKKKTIERETIELVKDGRSFARNMIAKNEEFINKLSEKLVKVKYLSRKDILALWSEFGNTEF